MCGCFLVSLISCQLSELMALPSQDLSLLAVIQCEGNICSHMAKAEKMRRLLSAAIVNNFLIKTIPRYGKYAPTL